MKKEYVKPEVETSQYYVSFAVLLGSAQNGNHDGEPGFDDPDARRRGYYESPAEGGNGGSWNDEKGWGSLW